MTPNISVMMCCTTGEAGLGVEGIPIATRCSTANGPSVALDCTCRSDHHWLCMAPCTPHHYLVGLFTQLVMVCVKTANTMQYDCILRIHLVCKFFCKGFSCRWCTIDTHVLQLDKVMSLSSQISLGTDYLAGSILQTLHFKCLLEWPKALH